MNTKSLAVIGGIALIGTQLVVLYKMLSVEEKIEKTRESVGVVKQDLQDVKKKVDDLEKIVLYKTKDQMQVSDQEFKCLAKNIYHEAGVESRAGKIAVAQVTLNRLKTERWGKNVCDVVYARAQFSWTLDKKKRKEQPKGKLWEESVEVAHEFVKGKRIQGVEKSHFYHTNYIRKPYWAVDMKVVKKVGQHIFYREV